MENSEPALDCLETVRARLHEHLINRVVRGYNEPLVLELHSASLDFTRARPAVSPNLEVMEERHIAVIVIKDDILLTIIAIEPLVLGLDEGGTFIGTGLVGLASTSNSPDPDAAHLGMLIGRHQETSSVYGLPCLYPRDVSILHKLLNRLRLQISHHLPPLSEGIQRTLINVSDEISILLNVLNDILARTGRLVVSMVIHEIIRRIGTENSMLRESLILPFNKGMQVKGTILMLLSSDHILLNSPKGLEMGKENLF